MTSGFLGIALSRIWNTFRTQRALSSSVSFIDEGRSGRIIYNFQGRTCDFYYEYGAGDVLVWISIPTANEWLKETGISVVYREEILHTVAKESIRLRNNGKGSYAITKDSINIFG